jgi:hypothetical protein
VEIDAIQASAESGAPLPEAIFTPGLQIPAGQPADGATVAAVEATYREIAACFNAGNDLAAAALWTDAGLRQVPFPLDAETASAPRPEGEWGSFRLLEVFVLSDGRVAAVVEQQAPQFLQTVVHLLTRQGDRLLIDETADAEVG